MRLKLRALTVGATLALAGLTGCSPTQSDPAPATPDDSNSAAAEADSDSVESAAPEEPADAEEVADSNEYAFGTDRDQIATAIETPYKNRNGSASWRGDTLVLSIDGDATDTMAGFSECRVISHFLTDGDTSEIEFPNGSVNCEELLDND